MTNDFSPSVVAAKTKGGSHVQKESGKEVSSQKPRDSNGGTEHSSSLKNHSQLLRKAGEGHGALALPRFVLQHVNTKLYFVRAGLWAERREMGHHFHSEFIARECSLIMLGSRVVPVAADHSPRYEHETLTRSHHFSKHIAGGL